MQFQIYRVGSSVHFTPRPGGVWVTDRLAVKRCVLPLVFIFASLVSCDIRFGWKWSNNGVNPIISRLGRVRHPKHRFNSYQMAWITKAWVAVSNVLVRCLCHGEECGSPKWFFFKSFFYWSSPVVIILSFLLDLKLMNHNRPTENVFQKYVRHRIITCWHAIPLPGNTH